MSCQLHRVISGQSNSGHKQIHISKLFSYTQIYTYTYIHIYQSSVKQGRQTERDKETETHRDSQTETIWQTESDRRLPDRLSQTERDIQWQKQTKRQTDKQTDRQSGRQRNRDRHKKKERDTLTQRTQFTPVLVHCIRWRDWKRPWRFQGRVAHIRVGIKCCPQAPTIVRKTRVAWSVAHKPHNTELAWSVAHKPHLLSATRGCHEVRVAHKPHPLPVTLGLLAGVKHSSQAPPLACNTELAWSACQSQAPPLACNTELAWSAFTHKPYPLPVWQSASLCIFFQFYF